ncbi:MAG: Cdc6/Cdc18 family protein [Candidatus Geothermarchaeales archaeon]
MESKTRSLIFRDKEALSPSYVPRQIRYREEQIDRLSRHVLRGRGPSLALVIGGRGTGKTLVCKKVFDDLSEKISPLTLYLDCRKDRSPGDIARALHSAVLPYEPLRGHSTQALFLKALEAMKDEDGAMVVLDHADITLRLHPTSAFLLSRAEAWPTSPNPILITIVIENLDTLSHLDSRASSTFRRNLIDFSSYSERELRRIVRQRVNDSFRKGAVSPKALEACAEVAMGENANAQYALDLLRDAGERAERRGALVVEPTDIENSISEIPSAFSIHELGFLNNHESMILLSLTHVLTKQRSYVTTGQLEREYRERCRRLSRPTIRHTTLWKCVKTLEILRIIRTKISRRGFRGRTTLINPNFPSPQPIRTQLMRLL